MKRARTLTALAVAGIFLLTGGGTTALAQSAGSTNGQGNGLKIAPVRNDLTIEKSGSRQVIMYVENITASPLKVRGITNDFIASDDESGEPRIILDENERAPGNSFKDLVGTLPTLTIQPNERREVRVTLNVPQDATSGGYYGAIRFAPDNGQSDENVALTASVGTIFLVRVPGELKEQLKIEGFDIANAEGITNSLFDSGPVSVVSRFRNFGNIHVEPFGKFVVKDMSGKVIQETEINNGQPRGSVLPNSIRKFSDKVEQEKLFGRYTVEGSFGYGTNGELLMAKKTFYVIPFKLIAAVIFGVAFLIFVLPKLIRAYNRSVIQRAQGGSQAKPKPRSRGGGKKK